MVSHADVLIVGGGVIGLTAAWRLVREGLRITIVDQGDMGQGASWAGAGIIPPGQVEYASTAIDQLRAHSSQEFPQFSAQLREATGIDNGYRRCGGIELIDPMDPPAVDAWRAECVDFESCEACTLARLVPAFAAGTPGGYYLPGMSQVRNPRHLKALIAAVTAFGVRLLSNRQVIGWDVAGERVVSARTEHETFPAEQFLISAGAWTDRLLQGLAPPVQVRPVRGQMALLRADPSIVRHIVQYGKRYIVPRGDGQYLVGSTEEEAGYDVATSADAIAELLQFARSLMPALGSAELIRAWAGLRPASADGLPYLGRLPPWRNVIIAAGHFRAGIQLSPATGRLIAELLMGQSPFLPLEPFAPYRPIALASRSAFRS